MAHVGRGIPCGVEYGHDSAGRWGLVVHVGAARGALHDCGAKHHAVKAAHEGRALSAGAVAQVNHNVCDIGAEAVVRPVEHWQRSGLLASMAMGAT